MPTGCIELHAALLPSLVRTGAYRLFGMGGTPENGRYAAFVDTWALRDVAMYNAHLPAAWQLPPDFFTAAAPSSEVRDVGVFEYDAAVALGLLLCGVVPRGPPPYDELGTLLWEAKEELTFEGLSGTVRFDAFGNRDAATANVRLTNMLRDADGGWSERTIAVADGGDWAWVGGTLEATGVVFGGGGTTVPNDCPQCDEDSGDEWNTENVVIGLCVVGGLIGAGAIGGFGFAARSAIRRTRKRESLLRLAE